MDYLTLGAFIFVCVFVTWGFFRGFWKSLAAIISLITAYFASVLLAGPCAKLLADHFGLGAVNDTILWGASGMALFIVVGFLVRLAVNILGKSLPIDSLIINRTGGAILSGGYGASMVIFIVWALSISLTTVNGATDIVQKMDVKMDEKTPMVVTWSRTIMSKILEWDVDSRGASAAVTEATTEFAKNPAKVLGSVKSTLTLPEFKALISNPTLQDFARNKDFESIKRSPEYTALMNHPAVLQLHELVMPTGTEKAKEDISNYMLSLWHDVDIVKNDPEFMRMIQDSEIQRFLKGGVDQISFSLLGKGKDLLAFVSQKADEELPPMPVVYKWYDDNGTLNVTHLDEVPSNKRDEAELVSP